MDSIPIYFGPLVVPATNFAGLLDIPNDVNIRTAWRGYLIRVQNTFSKVTCIFPINIRVKYWFWPFLAFKWQVTLDQANFFTNSALWAELVLAITESVWYENPGSSAHFPKRTGCTPWFFRMSAGTKLNCVFNDCSPNSKEKKLNKKIKFCIF